MPLPTTRTHLFNLIAFPAISADSNPELIAYLAERLGALGARVELSLDSTGAKANLFASLGPEIDGGVVLSGHTDVAPVEGRPRTSEPFTATERDGRIYGRGACDMKGFIAACMAMAPRFAAADLKRPVHFALTYD